MDLSPATLKVLLEDASSRDRTTARRMALVGILRHERYLTREQLIVRVEGILGKGCFGDSAWVDTFYRDMKVVKRALGADGYRLAYSRSARQPGYYQVGGPVMSVERQKALAGSVAEVDPVQIEVLKGLSYAQRFQQGCSITNLACRVVANRIQQRNPHIDPAEAWRMAAQQGSSP